MEIREILPGQSLLDIALQENGAIESVFRIAVRNGLNLTDPILPGRTLKVESDGNDPIVNEYRSTSIFPATALKEGLILEGIGYMSIEMDFIVH